jgi:hypothetical protein
MLKIMTATIASLSLLAACGGGGDGGSDDRAKVADELMKSAENEGLDVDAECVDKVAAGLSDADAQLMVDSIGDDEMPTLSDEGEAQKGKLLGCISSDALVQQMMDSIGDQPGMDKECLKGVLDELSSEDMASIAQSGGDLSGDVMTQLMQDVIPCMSAGG